MAHFTYRVPEDPSDLQQGDVLALTADIRRLLEGVHSYYANHEDYRFLLVLTQTCDLARRGTEACKSPYISVAAIRPLTTLLDRQLRSLQRSDTARAGGFDREETRGLLCQFVARLLNNNEPGYFYLHGEPGHAIQEPQVAFLTLSVALKAEHYEKCREVRVVGLQPEFQAKLGWLVGNIYSRVATRDWVPEACSDDDFRKLVDATVERLGIIWVPDRDFERVKKDAKKAANQAGSSVNPELVQRLAEKVAQEKEAKRSKLAARAAAILGDLGLVRDSTQLDRYRRQFESDPDVQRLVK